MSVLGTADAMVTTHENSVMMWSFKGPKLFCVLQNLLEMKKSDGIHIMVLPTSSILIRIWVEFLIGQFILEVTFSIRLGPMWWVPTAHCAGRRGLNLLTAVSPVELAHCVWVVICYRSANPTGGTRNKRTTLHLTLNVREPSLVGLTRSISWLLMPWLLASPGHQQPWYCLCRIGRSLAYSMRNFNYLCLISVEEWHKM